MCVNRGLFCPPVTVLVDSMRAASVAGTLLSKSVKVCAESMFSC